MPELEDQQVYFHTPMTNPAFSQGGDTDGMEQPLSHGAGKTISTNMTARKLFLSGINIGRSLNGFVLTKQDLFFGIGMIGFGTYLASEFGKTDNVIESLILSSSQVLLGFITSL